MILKMVIIMTGDWVKNLLLKNPYLTLPITTNSGKEVFKELNRKWNTFLSLLHSEKSWNHVLSLPNLVSIKSTRQRTFIIPEILDRPVSVCMR